jgi:hypothetical protein
MTVLNLDDCRKINIVVDYILDHPAKTVRNVKDMFSLSGEEYDMISELMMPAMRRREAARKADQEITKLKMQLMAKDEKIAELEDQILKGEMPDPNNIQSAPNGASFSSNPTAAIPENINIDTGYIDNLVKKGKEMENAYKLAASAVSSIGEAFANIEDPSAKAAGTVMQAIASIALGFATASAQANTAGTGWGWLAWVAAGAAAMATTISTIHSLTGFEHGGEIKGNSFSGDNTPIMANAGEVVLTRAMAGNIASQLQGSGNNVHVTGELRGESIYLAVNRSLKRRGKGELVTWK